MKTQILQLEAHDDILSARDKMGWGQAARILLVWPEEGRVLTRRLDLVLIQRHSTTLGAQLALVSGDSVVRTHARELGIPVFKTLRQAQRTPWTSGRRRRRLPAWRERRESLPENGSAPMLPMERVEQNRPPAELILQNFWLRVSFFTLGVLALLSIAVTLLPGARISLDPQTQVQSLSLSVKASPEIQSVMLSGSLPAQPVRVIVEGRNRVQTSGKTRFPDGYATVDLLFTNVTSQTLTIPQGTIVRTLNEQPVRFATTKAGKLAAGSGQSAVLPRERWNPGALVICPSILWSPSKAHWVPA